jgi:hypothetical protein
MWAPIAGLTILTMVFLVAGAASAEDLAGKDAPGGDIGKAVQDLGARQLAVRDMVQRSGGMLHQVGDDSLMLAFPQHLAYAVIFRMYPVARMAPAPLKTQNIFLVGKDGLVHVTDTKGLDDFFSARVGSVRDEFVGRNAARAWLSLSQQLKQDGFYRFAIPDDSLKWDNDARQASGRCEVKRGGNGDITVTLTFDASGTLTKVDETAKLRPGPRPICQATKLLDPDPVVRRMAEQDLLIMGREAKPYLDEQRGRAAPDLRKAIDRLWQQILREER